MDYTYTPVLSVIIPELVQDEESDFTVTVTDYGTGEVLEDYTVSAYYDNELLSSETTDEDGMCTFTLTPSEGGYHTISVEFEAQDDYEAVTNYDEVNVINKGILTATYWHIGSESLTGKVTDNDNNPVEGVEIIGTHLRQTIVGISDSEGEFDLGMFGKGITGDITVKANKEEYKFDDVVIHNG